MSHTPRPSFVVGIDPGMGGSAIAIASVEERRVLRLGWTRFDCADLRGRLDLVAQWARDEIKAANGAAFNDDEVCTVIERPGNYGRVSTVGPIFELIGMLKRDALGLVVDVTPQVWRKFYGIASRDRETGLRAARELFHGSAFAPSHKHAEIQAIGCKLPTGKKFEDMRGDVANAALIAIRSVHMLNGVETIAPEKPKRKRVKR